MARQAKCGKCGETAGYGNGIVVAWGGDGRLCPKCQPASSPLANGEIFVRKTDKLGDDL